MEKRVREAGGREPSDLPRHIGDPVRDGAIRVFASAVAASGLFRPSYPAPLPSCVADSLCFRTLLGTTTNLVRTPFVARRGIQASTCRILGLLVTKGPRGNAATQHLVLLARARPISRVSKNRVHSPPQSSIRAPSRRPDDRAGKLPEVG